MSTPSDPRPALRRWRLVLGRFSEQHLPPPAPGSEARREAALDFLYGREYEGRGLRSRGGRPVGRGTGDEAGADPARAGESSGTLDPTQLQVPHWINEVRDLFPREATEVIEKHALDRYGLTELLQDRATLEKLEPNLDLLKSILLLRSRLSADVLEAVRRIIRKVTDELRRRLESDVRRALLGRRNLFRHSPQKHAASFDWRGTLRRNLRHYDPEARRLVLRDPRFFARNQRFLPWRIILCVDQSGSMVSSVIHSAVMASIFCALPAFEVRLVAFDTSIVDLSEQAADSVETLLKVQLGGGTDIGSALTYAEQLVDNPHRTILVLVSDFMEGADPKVLLATVTRLREAGVKLLGLAALDDTARPHYDLVMAQQLADLGMDVAALTPNRLAEWIGRVIALR